MNYLIFTSGCVTLILFYDYLAGRVPLEVEWRHTSNAHEFNFIETVLDDSVDAISSVAEVLNSFTKT